MHCLMLNLVIWLTLLTQRGPDLLVTLTDVDGAPLVGATVIVRDAGGNQNLARTTTDAQGQASFATVAEIDVRVAVVGQLASGTRFVQPGNDAQGIALRLAIGTNRLDLLADVDGTILPDPRTMVALEPGIPVVTAAAPFPTAPLPSHPTVTAIAAVTRVAATQSDAAGGAVSPAAPVPEPGPIGSWLGAGLLVVLCGVGIGLIALRRRWR